MKRLILTRDSEEGIAELLGVIEQWHKQRIEDLETVRDSKDVKTITMQSVSGETIQVEADSELGLGVRVGIQAAINLFQELPFKVELLPGEDNEAPVEASPADEQAALQSEGRELTKALAKALVKSAGIATACEWLIAEGKASSMAEAESLLERTIGWGQSSGN